MAHRSFRGVLPRPPRIHRLLVPVARPPLRAHQAREPLALVLVRGVLCLGRFLFLEPSFVRLFVLRRRASTDGRFAALAILAPPRTSRRPLLALAGSHPLPRLLARGPQRLHAGVVAGASRARRAMRPSPPIARARCARAGCRRRRGRARARHRDGQPDRAQRDGRSSPRAPEIVDCVGLARRARARRLHPRRAEQGSRCLERAELIGERRL